MSSVQINASWTMGSDKLGGEEGYNYIFGILTAMIIIFIEGHRFYIYLSAWFLQTLCKLKDKIKMQ